MANYSLKITVTPQNKNGKWGKRDKNTTVADFATQEDAVNAITSNVKHLCKLVKQETDTFFVEVFILCNGNYKDCDRGVATFDRAHDELRFEDVCA